MIWDEMHLPIRYQDDLCRAEQILLEVAKRHLRDIDDVPTAAMRHIEHRFGIRPADLRPRVYWRITSNWLDMSLRFAHEPYGIRGVKDAISREVLPALRAAGIEVAAPSLNVVGFPANAPPPP